MNNTTNFLLGPSPRFTDFKAHSGFGVALAFLAMLLILLEGVPPVADKKCFCFFVFSAN